jgi:hypothetical protein
LGASGGFVSGALAVIDGIEARCGVGRAIFGITISH